MKKVELGPVPSDVCFEANIAESAPIFAKDSKGKIRGMFAKERLKGWILRFPHGGGCDGWHPTRDKAISNAAIYGYTSYTE